MFIGRKVQSSEKYCGVSFLLGDFLLPDRLSADGLSDSVGHRGCDVTAEVFREM